MSNRVDQIANCMMDQLRSYLGLDEGEEDLPLSKATLDRLGQLSQADLDDELYTVIHKAAENYVNDHSFLF